ncbi:hypothetical protein CEP52_013837 [Fusarium oligoseptatum]|uniref:Uncharacterized protein n=1 Tax=Fusarium oligoseptatum TaxID=2604345 RepID=A0A428SRT7_9HYPO|nr:hypothetical protein CEP52_013837 [Fusarium oligoseptatum]
MSRAGQQPVCDDHEWKDARSVGPQLKLDDYGFPKLPVPRNIIYGPNSNNPILIYDNKDDLTGTHSYSSRIGTDTISLTFVNRPKTEEKLNQPGIYPAVTVDGCIMIELSR